jgi:hypothetical protein
MGAQTEYDDEQKVKVAREMKVMSGRAMQLIKEGRVPYEAFRNDVADKFMEWGMRVDKIPPPDAPLNVVMEGFTNMDRAADDILATLAPQMQDVAAEDMPAGQKDPFSGAITPISGRGGAGGNARIDYLDYLTGDLSPEDEVSARRVAAGLDPRANLSADERIANDPNLSERVADSQSQIREAVKFAEMQGSQRSQYIDGAFTSVQKLDQNIRNIDKAIEAIDSGANTGFIESNFFPSIRAATVELEQVQNMLGLDVIGSVTFGALSKGELDLALETALPTGLQEDELKVWLDNKKVAQSRLREYYKEQMDHLDQGGSVASFMRQKERGKDVILQQARDAIAAGKPIDAIHKMLRDRGVDPDEL